MALPTSIVWELQTGGSNSNGGGFYPANTSMATDGAATSATGNSPVFTSASYTFVAGDVGAHLYVKAGTNCNFGWYPIVSVSAGAATLDATLGTGVRPNLTPSIVAGLATTASPTSITWTVDYSQQATPRYGTLTDLVIGATTTQFTSAANAVGKNMVGNILNVTGGTGFTVQRVHIASTSGTTATCDRSLGTTASTGGTGAIGGPFATLLAFTSTATDQCAYQTICVKTGTYSHGSQAIIQSPFTILGYGAVRGDRTSTKPILRASAAITMIGVIGLSNYAMNLIYLDLDGNSTGVSPLAYSSGTNALYYDVTDCVCRRWTSDGFPAIAGSLQYFLRCVIRDNGGNGIGCVGSTIYLTDCVITRNTLNGAGGENSNVTIVANNSIIAHNGGTGLKAYYHQHDKCTLYRNTGAAVYTWAGSARIDKLVNCVLYGNAYGVRSGSFQDTPNYSAAQAIRNCAVGLNTSGSWNFSSGYYEPTASQYVTLTGDPFPLATTAAVDAAGSDIDALFALFTPDNTAGAGAAIRAAGFPAGRDIGAVQTILPTPAQLAAAMWAYGHRQLTP